VNTSVEDRVKQLQELREKAAKRGDRPTMIALTTTIHDLTNPKADPASRAAALERENAALTRELNELRFKAQQEAK
jgi:transketolase